MNLERQMKDIEIIIVCHLQKSLSIVKSFCYNLRIQNENLKRGISSNVRSSKV